MYIMTGYGTDSAVGSLQLIYNSFLPKRHNWLCYGQGEINDTL